MRRVCQFFNFYVSSVEVGYSTQMRGSLLSECLCLLAYRFTLVDSCRKRSNVHCSEDMASTGVINTTPESSLICC